MTYSIIIPAYNETQRIGPSLDRVIAHVVQAKWQAEIIVVNDGSTDDTADIVRGFMSGNPNIRLVENQGNKGKGYSVRHGMLEANGDVLLLTDADLSAPIYEAKRLFDAIAAGADVAIGSRWKDSQSQTKRQSVIRQLGGRFFNGMNRILLGLQLKDTQCGFKAFTRAAAKSIFPPQKVNRWGFDPEILFLAKKLGFKIAEVPVEWAHDERSKINPITDGFSITWDIIRVRWFWLRGDYGQIKRVDNQA